MNSVIFDRKFVSDKNGVAARSTRSLIKAHRREGNPLSRLQEHLHICTKVKRWQRSSNEETAWRWTASGGHGYSNLFFHVCANIGKWIGTGRKPKLEMSCRKIWFIKCREKVVWEFSGIQTFWGTNYWTANNISRKENEEKRNSDNQKK